MLTLRAAIMTLAPVLVAPAMSAADVPAGKRVIECYCTDSTGGRVELGEMICLHVDGRSFTAQCQMSLNVPMWRELSEGCASSSLAPRLPQSRPRTG